MAPVAVDAGASGAFGDAVQEDSASRSELPYVLDGAAESDQSLPAYVACLAYTDSVQQALSPCESNARFGGDGSASCQIYRGAVCLLSDEQYVGDLQFVPTTYLGGNFCGFQQDGVYTRYVEQRGALTSHRGCLADGGDDF